MTTIKTTNETIDPATQQHITALTKETPENTVTVWSKKKHCMQCNMTLRMINNHNIKHKVFYIEDYPERVADILALGFLAVPVVCVGETIWSGFQPDLLKAIADNSVYVKTSSD